MYFCWILLYVGICQSATLSENLQNEISSELLMPEDLLKANLVSKTWTRFEKVFTKVGEAPGSELQLFLRKRTNNIIFTINEDGVAYFALHCVKLAEGLDREDAIFKIYERFFTELLMEYNGESDPNMLFYQLLIIARNFRESTVSLGCDCLNFLKVFNRILNGLAKIIDIVPGLQMFTTHPGLYPSYHFPEFLVILIERGLDVSKTEHLLHDAARIGNVDLTKALLNHGAQIDARDKYDKTPLMHAAQNVNVESLKILLAHGADRDLKIHWSRMTAQSLMESNYSYIHFDYESFVECRRLLSCPQILVPILVQKSIIDKLKVLRDNFVSFCHNIIEV